MFNRLRLVLKGNEATYRELAVDSSLTREAVVVLLLLTAASLFSASQLGAPPSPSTISPIPRWPAGTALHLPLTYLLWSAVVYLAAARLLHRDATWPGVFRVLVFASLPWAFYNLATGAVFLLLRPDPAELAWLPVGPAGLLLLLLTAGFLIWQISLVVGGLRAAFGLSWGRAFLVAALGNTLAGFATSHLVAALGLSYTV